MSPIDDELRTALQRRATVVAPSPDPLAGIERRAGRMRRNRIAASVAGSVLAVAAVATAVPLLTTPAAAPDAPAVVATQPDATLSPPATTSPYALDPAAPWPYRGTPLDDLGQGFVETATREYATRLGVPEGDVALTPLWGQVDEPSGQSELVFLATVGDQARRWGVAQATESGPEFLVDEPLPDRALALAAALPGDEVARLVVVTAPDAGRVEYFVDQAVEDGVVLTEVADGVVTGPLEGDPAADSLLVREADGRELWRGPAPDLGDAQTPTSGQDAPQSGQVLPPPTNVVDWPLRGAVPQTEEEPVKAEVARTAGVAPEQVQWRRLFGAERDGRFYGLAQVWFGGDAQLVAWVRDAGFDRRTVELFPPTAPGPAAVAAQFDDVVMVVPEPRTGQVLYAPEGAGEPVPVPDQGTEAAVLIERPSAAPDDRLLILDGNGDPERPVFRGTVDDLLAATAS